MLNKHAFAALCLFLFLIFSAQRARAQVNDAVYEDVKEIIGELIEQEVAQAIVPNLVCYSGYRAVPEKEAEYVLERAASAKKGDSEGASAKSVEKIPLAFEATTHFPRTLQKLYDRRYAELADTVRGEAADAVGLIVLSALRPSEQQLDKKIKGSSTEASKELLGNRRFARLNAKRLTRFAIEGDTEGSINKSIIYKPLPANDRAACAKKVGERFAGRKYLSPDASQLSKTCGPADRTVSCNVAQSIAAFVAGRDKEAEDYLVRVVAAVLAQQLIRCDPPPTGGLESCQRRDTEFPKPVIALRAYLDVHRHEATLIEALVKLANEGKWLGDSATTVPKLTLLVGPIGLLGATWNLTKVADRTMDVATFAKVMSSNSGYLGQVCGDRSGACQVLETLRSSNELPKILELARRGNYQELAYEAAVAVFPTPADCTTAGECPATIYRDFAGAVTLYVLDLSEGERSAATRQAFKDAAISVVSTISRSNGIDRSPWTWGAFLLPDLALRMSWNTTYEAARVIPTVSTVKFRGRLRYTNLAYVAVEPSVVDAVAPFTEFALRDNDDEYENETSVLWNFITPRLDFVFGIPAFSKHLVLGAGTSLRLVVPYELEVPVDQVEQSSRKYRYRPFLGTHTEVIDHIEFSLALSYWL